MQYNLWFLYASLAIMGLIGINYLRAKRNNLVGHRMFAFFLCAGILDVFLDLITCYQSMWQRVELIPLSVLCMTLFYILQIIFPYVFLLYSARVKNESSGQLDLLTRILSIPCLVMMILVFTNPITHVLFSIDENAVYSHGPWYMLMYVQVFLYMLVVLARTLYHRKENAKIAHSFFVYILIVVVCCLIQFRFPMTMMIGFGIGLGIMVMYINISNPDIFIDYMTGAFNRRGLTMWLNRRRKECYAVIFNFPHMAKMNQVYGIANVNAMLSQSMQLLQNTFVNQQTFRFSNTKFLSISETKEQAERIAAWMKEHFCSEIPVNGTKISCHTQVCLAKLDEEMLASHSVIEYCTFLITRGADIGADSVTTDMQQKQKNDFLYEQEIERYLIQAVEEDLFTIHMQPIYSTEKKRFVAVEVLSRLKHPTLGMVSPDLFITLAEKNGTIDQITLLQFHRVCRFMKAHPQIMEQLDAVKFNLSPHELIAHDYDKVLPEVIRAYGLPLEKFEFEITETVATEYSKRLKSFTESLLEQGIRLNMDDFGSGYANISNVLGLPFSYIKLDRSLLLHVCEDEQAATLYEELIRIFHRLGFGVISEGVETEEEAGKLSAWGVDMIQGYYFSKPLPETELEKLFAQACPSDENRI